MPKNDKNNRVNLCIILAFFAGLVIGIVSSYSAAFGYKFHNIINNQPIDNKFNKPFKLNDIPIKNEKPNLNFNLPNIPDEKANNFEIILLDYNLVDLPITGTDIFYDEQRNGKDDNYIAQITSKRAADFIFKKYGNIFRIDRKYLYIIIDKQEINDFLKSCKDEGLTTKEIIF